MLTRLKRAISGVARRLAVLPLHTLSPEQRAQVLYGLNEKMISATPVPGGTIHFYTPSPLLRSRAAGVLTKETDTIHWIEGFADGSVFWDIGANVGTFSLYAAIRKRISVLAFEPSAPNFHVLSRNFQLNELTDRATAYCLAFSDRTQLGILNMAASEMGGAVNQFGQPGEMSRYADAERPGAAQGMIGITVDDFINQFAPPFPNYLKMDVDGLELPILKGARQTLSDPRLRALMVELSLTNESERGQALHLLEVAGWRLIVQGASQGTPTERAANHFFERLTK